MTRPKNENSGVFFCLILLFEAVLSIMPLERAAILEPLVTWMAGIAPVIENIEKNTTTARAVPAFMALTIALLPLKAYAAIRLICSIPLTEKKIYFTFPTSSASTAAKVRSSIAAILLTIGTGWYVLFAYAGSYFQSDALIQSAAAKASLVTKGGVSMWVGWSVMHLTILSLLLGLSLLIFSEWKTVVTRNTKGIRKRNFKWRNK